MPKITSWNVNGLKGLCSRYGTLEKALQQVHSEIICFQETKLVNASALRSDICISRDFFSFFSICSHSNRHEKAYSGTATFVRKDIPVLRAQQGLTGRLSSSRQSLNTDADDMIVYIEPYEVKLTKEELQLLDAEGRCVITDHGSFILFNVYAPNAHPCNMISACRTSDDERGSTLKWEVSIDTDVNDLKDRYVFKIKFNYLLSFCIRKLQLRGKKVILVGDLNVNSLRLDHCEAENHDYIEPFGSSFNCGGGAREDSAGDSTATPDKKRSDHDGNFWRFSFESRPHVVWMKNMLSTEPQYIADNVETFPGRTYHANPLLSVFSEYLYNTCGMIDTFRHHWPSRENAFTCWNSLTGARKTNFGTRLDYVLVSASLICEVTSADINPSVEGSDHCPVHCCFSMTLFTAHQLLQPLPPPSLCTIYANSSVQTSLTTFVAKTSSPTALTKTDDTTCNTIQLYSSASANAAHTSSTKRSRSSSSSKSVNPLSVAIMESLFRRTPHEKELGIEPSDSTDHIENNIESTTGLTRKTVDSDSPPKRMKSSTSTISTSVTAASIDLTHSPPPSLSSFKALFTPVSVPVCSGHGEKCVIRTVIKAGPNEGKR